MLNIIASCKRYASIKMPLQKAQVLKKILSRTAVNAALMSSLFPVAKTATRQLNRVSFPLWEILF